MAKLKEPRHGVHQFPKTLYVTRADEEYWGEDGTKPIRDGQYVHGEIVAVYELKATMKADTTINFTK